MGQVSTRTYVALIEKPDGKRFTYTFSESSMYKAKKKVKSIIRIDEKLINVKEIIN